MELQTFQRAGPANVIEHAPRAGFPITDVRVPIVDVGVPIADARNRDALPLVFQIPPVQNKRGAVWQTPRWLFRLVLAEGEYIVSLVWLQEILRQAILEIVQQLFVRHVQLGAAVPENAAAKVGLHLAFQ